MVLFVLLHTVPPTPVRSCPQLIKILHNILSNNPFQIAGQRAVDILSASDLYAYSSVPFNVPQGVGLPGRLSQWTSKISSSVSTVRTVYLILYCLLGLSEYGRATRTVAIKFTYSTDSQILS
jgi:hypothetical protein